MPNVFERCLRQTKLFTKHTPLRNSTARAHWLQGGSPAPRVPSTAHPTKQAAYPRAMPHASMAWPGRQCSNPAHTPGPLPAPNHAWYVQVCPTHRHPTPGAKRGPAQTLPLPPISFLPAAPFQVENDLQLYVVSFRQTSCLGQRGHTGFSIDLKERRQISLGISRTNETWFLMALCPDSFALPPSPLQSLQWTTCLPVPPIASSGPAAYVLSLPPSHVLVGHWAWRCWQAIREDNQSSPSLALM